MVGAAGLEPATLGLEKRGPAAPFTQTIVVATSFILEGG